MLTKCPHCGNQVSSDAPACPQCGRSFIASEERFGMACRVCSTVLDPSHRRIVVHKGGQVDGTTQYYAELVHTPCTKCGEPKPLLRFRDRLGGNTVFLLALVLGFTLMIVVSSKVIGGWKAEGAGAQSTLNVAKTSFNVAFWAMLALLARYADDLRRYRLRPFDPASKAVPVPTFGGWIKIAIGTFLAGLITLSGLAMMVDTESSVVVRVVFAGVFLVGIWTVFLSVRRIWRSFRAILSRSQARRRVWSPT